MPKFAQRVNMWQSILGLLCHMVICGTGQNKSQSLRFLPCIGCSFKPKAGGSTISFSIQFRTNEPNVSRRSTVYIHPDAEHSRATFVRTIEQVDGASVLSKSKIGRTSGLNTVNHSHASGLRSWSRVVQRNKISATVLSTEPMRLVEGPPVKRSVTFLTEGTGRHRVSHNWTVLSSRRSKNGERESQIPAEPSTRRSKKGDGTSKSSRRRKQCEVGHLKRGRNTPVVGPGKSLSAGVPELPIGPDNFPPSMPKDYIPWREEPAIELLQTAVHTAQQHKAGDIVVLRTRYVEEGCRPFWMILHAFSYLQLRTICNSIKSALELEHGLQLQTSDNHWDSGWIVMDFEYFLVSVMTPFTRLKYTLETRHRDAEKLDIDSLMRENRAKQIDPGTQLDNNLVMLDPCETGDHRQSETEEEKDSAQGIWCNIPPPSQAIERYYPWINDQACGAADQVP